MNDPVEEYLLTKEAGLLGKAWQAVKPHAERGAAGLGIAVVGMAALRGMDNAFLAITKKRDFNKMMEDNPDLQESFQENPKQFHAQFTSLRSMNPSFSSDPIVAGTYMRQMSASPATAGTAMVGAASQRKSMPPSIFEAAAPRAPMMPFQTGPEREMEQLKLKQMQEQPDPGELQGARMGEMEQQADLAGERAARDKAFHGARMKTEATREEEMRQRMQQRGF